MYDFTRHENLHTFGVLQLSGQCTKKGLGTINKEKTREIEHFARIEILVMQLGVLFFILICLK